MAKPKVAPSSAATISSVNPSIKDWYKINEIPLQTYIALLKDIYTVLENKNKPKSEEDIFARTCWSSYYDITLDDLDEERKRIQKEKAFTMKLGDFHQHLMGSFSDWEDYGIGHETGCDVGKTDGTCIAEVKNNTNTMNSSSQESVMNKLKKQVELGKRAILVIVNGDIKQKNKDGVIWMSGRDFYKELSGRDDFFNDLLSTLQYTFANYKTYNELLEPLKIS